MRRRRSKFQENEVENRGKEERGVDRILQKDGEEENGGTMTKITGM